MDTDWDLFPGSGSGIVSHSQVACAGIFRGDAVPSHLLDLSFGHTFMGVHLYLWLIERNLSPGEACGCEAVA